MKMNLTKTQKRKLRGNEYGDRLTTHEKGTLALSDYLLAVFYLSVIY